MLLKMVYPYVLTHTHTHTRECLDTWAARDDMSYCHWMLGHVCVFVSRRACMYTCVHKKTDAPATWLFRYPSLCVCMHTRMHMHTHRGTAWAYQQHLPLKLGAARLCMYTYVHVVHRYAYAFWWHLLSGAVQVYPCAYHVSASISFSALELDV